MKSQERLIKLYDRVMQSGEMRRYYGDSGFFNFGYWSDGATSQGAASEALVDQLVQRIPNPGKGNIIDVACGLGATTRRLMRYYPHDRITAINVSEAQLAQGRKRAPGCTFLKMDATKLEFPSEHFDAVMCVEAAFHFVPRTAFFAEACRVLKPGGTLVLSDMLFRRSVSGFSPKAFPKVNDIADIGTYRAQLVAAGFEMIDVTDATEEVMGGFYRSIRRFPREKRRDGTFKFGQGAIGSVVANGVAAYYKAATRAYLLVSARKPVSPGERWSDL